MLFAFSFVRRPMLPLAIGVAILDEHTRLARLETNAPINATLGTAADRCFVAIIHPDFLISSPQSFLFDLVFGFLLPNPCPPHCSLHSNTEQ
jgi:hypothetical protein